MIFTIFLIDHFTIFLIDHFPILLIDTFFPRVTRFPLGRLRILSFAQTGKQAQGGRRRRRRPRRREYHTETVCEYCCRPGHTEAAFAAIFAEYCKREFRPRSHAARWCLGREGGRQRSHGARPRRASRESGKETRNVYLCNPYRRVGLLPRSAVPPESAGNIYHLSSCNIPADTQGIYPGRTHDGNPCACISPTAVLYPLIYEAFALM